MRRNTRSAHHARDAGANRKRESSFESTRPGGDDDLVERAVLAGVLLPDTKADLRAPLAELEALAESAGVEVMSGLVQKRLSLSASHAIGKGKLEELCELANAHDANVVIFDNDLSPRQIRSLEESLQMKVIDRSELILDIFAARARTREAQLQVELAQLEYTAPRLRGMWTHLERIAGAGGGTAAGAVGGVGTRGPGERQIEIDRRIVKDRIAALRREIDDIAARKRREVQARSDQFNVSLVGYTNSGKTTLMNALTRAEQYAADQLFATLDSKTVRWDLGEGRRVLLSDTVGFVRDLPHHLVASFRATLEEATHADLLLHVVDASSPFARQQIAAVDEVLAGLGCMGIRQLTLLNKIDEADDSVLAELLASGARECLQISALHGDGLAELAAHVGEIVQGDLVELRLFVPHAAGKAMFELDRLGEVTSREYRDDGTVVELAIGRKYGQQIVGRFRGVRVLAGVLFPGDPEDDSAHR